MMKKFKRDMEKLNALMENGYVIISIDNNGINISNQFIINCDDETIYFHRVNECVNHNWLFYDKLNFKTLKLFIDNLMYDISHGLITP